MGYGNIDFESEEYKAFVETSKKYFEAKEKCDRYAMMFRITTHDTHARLAAEQRRLLPHLASDKRKAWGKLLRLTREAQNDE